MTLRRRLRRVTAPWRRLKAHAGGYFWLPCPMCGEPFAGFETAPMLAVPVTDHTDACVCRTCEDEYITATAPLCARVGHEPVPIWRGHMVRQERTTDGVSIGMWFRVDGGPDEVRCARCHIQLAAAR